MLESFAIANIKHSGSLKQCSYDVHEMKNMPCLFAWVKIQKSSRVARYNEQFFSAVFPSILKYMRSEVIAYRVLDIPLCRSIMFLISWNP